MGFAALFAPELKAMGAGVDGREVLELGLQVGLVPRQHVGTLGLAVRGGQEGAQVGSLIWSSPSIKQGRTCLPRPFCGGEGGEGLQPPDHCLSSSLACPVQGAGFGGGILSSRTGLSPVASRGPLTQVERGQKKGGGHGQARLTGGNQGCRVVPKPGPAGTQAQGGTQTLVRRGRASWREGSEDLYPGLGIVNIGSWGRALGGTVASTGLTKVPGPQSFSMPRAPRWARPLACSQALLTGTLRDLQEVGRGASTPASQQLWP